MRVNSVFRGLFSTRWVVGSGLVVVMLAIFSIASSFTKPPQRELLTKQVNLLIRQLGHRLLLQAGDSTSRVLPVREIATGTFLLAFENELIFNHDSLIVLSQTLLPKTQFPSGFTLTVHEWMKSDIAYGFQVNHFSPNQHACRGRSEPRGCYTIEIAFPDLYKGMEAVANTIPGDSHSENFQGGSLLASRANQPQPLIYLVLSGLLVVLGTAILILSLRKKVVPASWPTQDNSGQNAEPHSPGKVLLELKDQQVVLGNEVIPLTDKECRILELLNNNFGELIPRETLVQEVWLNEGVITGRSLDMFISKLRKKLSVDPDLRIANVHGKGYKLEMQR